MKGTLGRITKLAQHYLPHKNAASNGGIHPNMAPKDMWNSLTAAGTETVGKSGRSWLSILRWPALMVVIASVGIFYYLGHTEPVIKSIQTPGHFELTEDRANGVRLVVDSCGHAGSFNLALPDSTRVRLCYGSSLRYVSNFGDSTREVYLDGQASFDIAPDKEHPFIVHTGMATVRVLGTCFNVMAYDGEPAEITVLSGAVVVQVIHGNSSRVMKSSEQAVVTGGKMTLRKLYSVASVIAWAGEEPGLDFENADVNTVIRQLARWYQVRVSNPRHVKGIAISGFLKLGDPLSKNLALIRSTERGYMQVEEKADTIILTKPVR